MAKTERKIEVWGKEDDEQLTHTEMDDAIESELEGMEDPLPETIDVCGFARSMPNAKRLAGDVLERLLENLDAEYGNPDGYMEYTDQYLESMKAAAEEFVAAVLDKYTVWACDFVKREKVNVQEWIKANRPDWLEENDNGRND